MKKKSSRGLSEAARQMAGAGASKGGKARAAKLTQGKRSSIARQGGNAKAAKGKK